MDWTAALWQRPEGTRIERYGGSLDTGYAKGLAKTIADDRFLIGYTWRTAIYDAESGQQLYTFRPPCDGITAIGMAPSGRFFATGSSDGILLIFSEHCELLWQAEVRDGPEIVCAAVSDDEGWIVWGDTSGNLTLLDMRRGVTKLVPNDNGVVGCVSFRPGSTVFYSGHASGKLCGWDAATALIIVEIQAHKDRVAALSCIDESTIASASWDGNVTLWSLPTLAQSSFLNVGEPITCMDYRKEDRILLLGLSDGDLAAFQRIICESAPNRDPSQNCRNQLK